MREPIISDDPAPPIYYSIDGACAASGLNRTALYFALGAGKIAARKCGRRTLIDGESLRQYLDSLPPAEIRCARSHRLGASRHQPDRPAA